MRFKNDGQRKAVMAKLNNIRVSPKYTEIRRTDKMLFICPFCNKSFNALAYHTAQVHKITGRELRKMFGLKYNYQLTTKDIKERHRQIVFENKESHINKNLLYKGKDTRYKKGYKGHIKEEWSPQAIHEIKKRFKGMSNAERKVENN